MFITKKINKNFDFNKQLSENNNSSDMMVFSYVYQRWLTRSQIRQFAFL